MSNYRDFLFLDFDGVINKSDDFIGYRHVLPIHEPALQRVTEFVEEHNLRVVISSSHRKLHVTPETLKSRLGSLVDYFHPDWKTGADRKGHRGNEVRDWIIDHPTEVERYIIFDDDSDFYAYQPFLKVDHHFGFSELDFLRAEEMLLNQSTYNTSPLSATAELEGDLLRSRCVAIAHGCNAQGKMRSGVAKAIREMHPEAYEAYMKAYKDNGLPLGSVSLAESKSEHTYSLSRYIFNVVTQRFYGYDGKKYVDYDAMAKGLTETANLAAQMGIYEVGIPRIGADRGGGDWETINRIIAEAALVSGIKYTIFTLPQVQSSEKDGTIILEE